MEEVWLSSSNDKLKGLLFLPIVAFTADGLSVMATKLGNIIMLDSYTSSCVYNHGIVWIMLVH